MFVFVVCKTFTHEVGLGSFLPALYFSFAYAVPTLKEKESIAYRKFTTVSKIVKFYTIVERILKLTFRTVVLQNLPHFNVCKYKNRFKK